MVYFEDVWCCSPVSTVDKFCDMCLKLDKIIIIIIIIITAITVARGGVVG